MSSVHAAVFVKDCLCDWYGEVNVSGLEKTAAGFIITAYELYSVTVHADHSYTLSTSRYVGPSRVYSGMFLDLLVDAAEKEFPNMQKRQMVAL
jgi:hypothetical protein